MILKVQHLSRQVHIKGNIPLRKRQWSYSCSRSRRDWELIPRSYSSIVDTNSMILSCSSGYQNVINALPEYLNYSEHTTAVTVTHASSTWTTTAVSNPYLITFTLAWINNCVGINNFRYFLLFILYIFIGCLYCEILTQVTYDHKIFKDNSVYTQVIYIFHLVLGCVMIPFNMINWYLCFAGAPQVEIWQEIKNKPRDVPICKFKSQHALSKWKDNIFMTFGTRDMWKVLLPARRPLPLTGIEWTIRTIEKVLSSVGEDEGLIKRERPAQP